MRTEQRWTSRGNRPEMIKPESDSEAARGLALSYENPGRRQVRVIAAGMVRAAQSNVLLCTCRQDAAVKERIIFDNQGW